MSNFNRFVKRVFYKKIKRLNKIQSLRGSFLSRIKIDIFPIVSQKIVKMVPL